MASTTEVVVPDIGDFDNVPVIEVLVSAGDRVNAEDPLITLESDKATMDVPSPEAGVVKELRVAVGDTVSEGSAILVLEADGDASGDRTSGDAEAKRAPAEESADSGTPRKKEDEAETKDAAPESAGESAMEEVLVPDIGDFKDVPVIEVLVAPGDSVKKEDALITLESDKAAMDVPSPHDGEIGEVRVSVGDTVSKGSVILTLKVGAAKAESKAKKTETADEKPAAAGAAREETETPARGADVRREQPRRNKGGVRPSPTAAISEGAPAPRRAFHATPAVRRFARELGVDLARVRGTGRKGRILREDVKGFVKDALGRPAAAAPSAAGIEPVPAVDFSRFGETETRPLSRIKKISGPHLHRAWLNVPHVTHHDEADITELEAFRKSLKPEAEKKGVRLTALGFIMKAAASALAEFPGVNSSLSPDGESLIFKKYFHIGIAVDTPNGLVVPVFRDVDKKGIYELAEEMADVSARAREGKLKPDEMQGGCMSISSLGGIGGTGFTPIVNAPEVAILGVTRARMTPVWNGTEFVPRLMLPLDLSYDHRVVDGAEAARFVAFLCGLLGDLRRLLL